MRTKRPEVPGGTLPFSWSSRESVAGEAVSAGRALKPSKGWFCICVGEGKAKGEMTGSGLEAAGFVREEEMEGMEFGKVGRALPWVAWWP